MNIVLICQTEGIDQCAFFLWTSPRQPRTLNTSSINVSAMQNSKTGTPTQYSPPSKLMQHHPHHTPMQRPPPNIPMHYPTPGTPMQYPPSNTQLPIVPAKLSLVARLRQTLRKSPRQNSQREYGPNQSMHFSGAWAPSHAVAGQPRSMHMAPGGWLVRELAA